MPATPAWPPESGIRLFIETRLEPAQHVRIENAQAHYLATVMRVKPGMMIRVFDDVTGEWRAEVTTVGKRDVLIDIREHLMPRETVRDLWLAAAPIRRARYDWVAEKACELGVAHFIPVATRRAVVDKIKPDRLRSHMIEAAEQCGRTALPQVAEQIALPQWLATCDRTIFFADEGGGVAIAEAINAHPGPAAILIGPEGGFDNDERAIIRAHPKSIAVSLGRNILRADTAAIAAVAIWMAVST